MASSTIFKNFTVPVENKSLFLIANDIATDKYKVEVEEIQVLLGKAKRKKLPTKKSNY